MHSLVEEINSAVLSSVDRSVKQGVTQKTGTFEMSSGSHVQLAALRNRDFELQIRMICELKSTSPSF